MKNFYNFCTMVIVLLVMSCSSMNAKTNVNRHNDRHAAARTEMAHHRAHGGHRNKVVVVEHRGPAHHMGHHMHRHMDGRMREHMLMGRHIFGRHHVCRVCHMTPREIRHFEREIRRY